MPTSVILILGLSNRIKSEFAFALAFWNTCQENGPLTPSLKSSYSIVWERKMAAFSSVLFLCHLAHSCVFGKSSLCNPNCCASLLWINEKILALCESVPCCGGHDGYNFQNPAHPTPWQEFPGIIPTPELLLLWQCCLLDLQPIRKTAFFQEIILRKEMQPGWNHLKSPGLGWLLEYTDMLLFSFLFFFHTHTLYFIFTRDK